MKVIPDRKKKYIYMYGTGIKQKCIAFDLIQSHVYRLDKKYTCLRRVFGGWWLWWWGGFKRILRLTYGVTFVAFRDLGGVVVWLRGGV